MSDKMHDPRTCGHDHTPNAATTAAMNELLNRARATPPSFDEIVKAMQEGKELPLQGEGSTGSTLFIDLTGLLGDINVHQPDQPEGEPRWVAEVDYRHDDGIRTKTHALKEIADLDAIVENGPHWDTVDAIRIKRVNHINGDGLTVEVAETL